MTTASTATRYIVLISLLTCTAMLFRATTCAATDIQATVMPVRIIYVDYNDTIVTIASNTKQRVTPTVRRTGSHNTAVLYTDSIRAQYERALQRYDFSRPVEVHVKKPNAWEQLMNYVIDHTVHFVR